MLFKLADDVCPVIDGEEDGFEEEHQVKEFVARNTNATRPIFEKLSEDINIDVKIAVAKNSSAPSDIVSKLTKDDHPLVAQEAKIVLEHRRQSTMNTLNSINDNIISLSDDEFGTEIDADLEIK